MYDPAPDSSPAPEYPNPLARADALEREITDLCAQINAASYRLLQLVAELDDEEPWGSWGLTSCAHFLNWRCGIGMNAAREKVRVAHALKQLPLISASFATGELSFSKVRAVTRIADPDNEKELLELARYATAAQVEKLVRAYRGVERQAERERAAKQHDVRELNYYYDDDGSLVIRARLPAEEGAVVLQALNAAMDARSVEQNEAESDDVTAVTSEPPDSFSQRRADALTTLAETTLRHGPTALSAAERYQVVVHVTAETLAADDAGRCELDNGQRLALDTVRRITCDSSLLRITEDDAGNPLDIGRKTRAVPPAMRRALQARDGGCRFPGCNHHRFVDAHHIRHWADGGDTSIDNLVLLCRRHHILVHEDGFGVERSADGEIRFSRSNGRFIEEHPQLPATGSVEGLLGPTHRRRNRETGEAIDASCWIIPGDTLDYGMAIEGLVRKHERESCREGQQPEQTIT
ncbi:MAG: DUF222 domain-containing protein [Gammaproteobacteria bacterium]|nr:DUF222 domain-containing protein [Gammaproteobacteria bacterium]